MDDAGGLAFHATSLSSLLNLRLLPQTKKEKVQSPNPSLIATTIACKHVGCKIPSTEFYVYIKPLAASFTGIRAHSRWI